MTTNVVPPEPLLPRASVAVMTTVHEPGPTSGPIVADHVPGSPAVNGELSPFASGVTACRMIGACRDLTDYRRASEWIEATEQYCERRSLKGFPGVCRVHRAEVAAIGGHWAEANKGSLRDALDAD